MPEKVPQKAPATSTVDGLWKQSRYNVIEPTSLNDSVDSILSSPSIDTCLLRQVRRQVNCMDSKLADVAHKLLSLDDGEQELMDKRSKVKKLLLQVDPKIERLPG